MPRLGLLAFLWVLSWAPMSMALRLRPREKKPRVSPQTELLFPPPGASLPTRPTFYVGLPKGARVVRLVDQRLRVVDLGGVELRVRRTFEADARYRIVVLEASEPLQPALWTLQGLPSRRFGGLDPDFVVREEVPNESPRWRVRVLAEPEAKSGPLAILVSLEPTGPDSDHARAMATRHALITRLDGVVTFGSERAVDGQSAFALPLELTPGVRHRLSLRFLDGAGAAVDSKPRYFSTSLARPRTPAAFTEFVSSSPATGSLLVLGVLLGPVALLAARRRRQRVLFRGDASAETALVARPAGAAPQSSDLAFRLGSLIRRSSGSSWGR